jgi:DNA-binding PadR family transcriptional regulator
MFLKNGLIEKSGLVENNEQIYKATEKGEKMIDILCNTPFPILKYIDPREEKGI